MANFESKYLKGEPHEVADYIYDFFEGCTVINVMGDIDEAYCQKLAEALGAQLITIEDMVSCNMLQKPEKGSLVVLKLYSKKY